jgi:hypothetical protein
MSGRSLQLGCLNNEQEKKFAPEEKVDIDKPENSSGIFKKNLDVGRDAEVCTHYPGIWRLPVLHSLTLSCVSVLRRTLWTLLTTSLKSLLLKV